MDGRAYLGHPQILPVVAGRRVIHATWGGHPVPIELTPHEFRAFKRALENGFIVVGKGSGYARLAWYCWCEALGQPAVQVRLRKRTATVSVDMWTTRYKFTRLRSPPTSLRLRQINSLAPL